MPAQSDDRVRVFLLDDHEVVREGLRSLIEFDGNFKVVGDAATCADALARAKAVRPDVALLDVQLPDGSGVEVCRELRSILPDLSCLMLTSFSDEEAMLDSVVAGAAGFVLKQVRGRELVDALNRVAAGEILLDPRAVARQRKMIDQASKNGDHRASALTDTERQILELVADGLTNKEIADELIMAPKTVKNSISSILLKLGMTRRVNAAVYAVRTGLR